MDTSKDTIGSRLEQVKLHYKLTNNDIGKIAGVSHQAISDIVKGETDNPKVSLLVKISDHLQVNLNWLAKGQGEMFDLKGVEKETIGNDIVQFLMNQIAEKDNTIRVLLGKSDRTSIARFAFFLLPLEQIWVPLFKLSA